MEPKDPQRYTQLLDDGFCVFENVLDAGMLERFGT